jgi:hypothetical protein
VAAFQECDKKRLHISVPMIIHGFSKKQANVLSNSFSFGKYLLRTELELLLKASLTIVFSWKRILLKKIYMPYMLWRQNIRAFGGNSKQIIIIFKPFLKKKLDFK